MAKMRDGAQWLSNHYAANDYYCENEQVVGSWVGKGAEISGHRRPINRAAKRGLPGHLLWEDPEWRKAQAARLGHHRLRLPMFGTEERLDHGKTGR